jgi:FPC/CPF motif-containing protein YcgG
VEFDRLLESGVWPGWGREAYLEFRTKVLDPAFPCTFGTVAMRRGDLMFALLTPADDHDERRLVREVLVEYTTELRGLDAQAASMRPLVVLMPTLPGTSQRAYFDRGWRLLEWLARHDTHGWPARVPTDPEDPAWTFCFGDMPLFVNFKTPAHERRSRQTRCSYALLFQARDGFDHVAGNTEAGRRARTIIRRKLEAFDGMSVHHALAHYGTLENREWKQYFLADGSAGLIERCPWRVPT